MNTTTNTVLALNMAPNNNPPPPKKPAAANNALYKQKKGRIAKAFPKSYKNKAKSYEFMMMHQQQQKMNKDDDKNDEDVAKEQGLMMKMSDDDDEKNDEKDDDNDDEKHYVLDLGEMQRRLASERNTTNTRRSNTTNKRVGYQSAKGKRGGGRTINQNANLADLDLADEETVRNALSSLPVSHYEERKRKAESLEMRYPEWFRYLTHDFSVLLYGFGSKKQVLEDFARRYLLDGAVVVVNGYQQRVSALAILNQCAFALSDESENLMHHHSSNNNNGSSNNGFADVAAVANNAQALLRRIAELTTDHSGGGGEKTNENGDAMMMHNITNNTTTTTTTGGTAATKNTRGSRRDGGSGNNSAAALASLRDANVNASYERDKNHYQSTASFNDGGSASRLYLVVHNIDGVAMRNAETQSILGELSSFPRVHLIASVDHVNAPLLWSKREAAKFNWIYQKAVTFAPYAKETANDPQLLASKGEERHVRGAANVLKSLTRNARIIYRIIAEAQISENGQGLTFPQLFQLSRESFLVTAELALRGVLTEFTDHELIKIKKVSDNEDLITVPMDNNALEQLVEDECEEIHNFF